MTVQTWPAARKPCTRLSGEERIASIAGGTSTCETSMREVREAQLLRLVDGHRVGGRGGLEADREEDDLPVRVLRARARTASSGE